MADSYLPLKSQPLYYFDHAYYVLNWSYLLSQIYVGTFKALKNEIEPLGIGDFKKEAGVIIEDTLFRSVLTRSFGQTWQKAMFDKGKRGLPDAMFTMSNHLFVIELKDRLMDDETMESFDYDRIVKHLEDNFVGEAIIKKGKERFKKKGISQLAVYIKTYKSGGYGEVPYNHKLNIYPILVCTDYKYRMNGINKYLSMRFDELVRNDEDLASIKHRIRPLTVIGLDCLFNLQLKFRSKQIKLPDIIDAYHKKVKMSGKRYADKGVEKFSQLYPSFDRYVEDNRNVLMSLKEVEKLFKKNFFHIKASNELETC